MYMAANNDYVIMDPNYNFTNESDISPDLSSRYLANERK